MFPAEFFELFLSGRKSLAYFFSEISERGIDPQGPLCFLVDDRNDPQLRQPCFSFIAYVNYHEIMFSGKRFKIMKVSFVNEVRDKNDDAPSSDGIQGKCKGLGEIRFKGLRI